MSGDICPKIELTLFPWLDGNKTIFFLEFLGFSWDLRKGPIFQVFQVSQSGSIVTSK